MRNAGISKVEDLRDMLGNCDFVSVHCVLNDDTYDLVSEAEFKCMKPTAFLINTCRGAVVNEQAMLKALKSGQIAGAGLDVYCDEPVAHSGHALSELYGMPNVILMPHLTFYTRESMQRLEQETLDRCREALQGKPLQIKSRDPRLLSQEHGVSFTS